MCCHLYFLKVRLTTTLSEDALVLTTGPLRQLAHGRIVECYRRDAQLIVLLDLKVEHL